MRYSSTTETAGYYGTSVEFAFNSATAFTGTQIENNNASQFTCSRGLTSATGTDPKSTGYMYYIAPSATSKPSWHGQFISGYYAGYGAFGGTQYGTSRAYTGILFKSSSSNITGTVAIYGVSQ